LGSYNCIVQQGCTTPELRAEIARELAGIDTNMLGGSGDASTVDFVEMPRGSGFTGGELSTTSIVNVVIPGGCPYQTRKTLMTQICALWYKKTGCSADELVVFTTDGPRRE
jgi:hypothetical protein